MQTFQVTSPNTCGITINGTEVFYFSGTGYSINTSDSHTFEQFETQTEALTRALEIDSNFDGSAIFGSITFTPVDVTTDISPAIGDAATLSAEYTASEAGATLTYAWYKTVENNAVLLPGANTETISTSSLTEDMRGQYWCEVTATYDTNKTVGYITTPFMNVLAPAATPTAATAIGVS